MRTKSVLWLAFGCLILLAGPAAAIERELAGVELGQRALDLLADRNFGTPDFIGPVGSLGAAPPAGGAGAAVGLAAVAAGGAPAGGVSPQMLEMGRQLMAQGMSAGQIAQMAQQQGMNLSAEQVQQALGGGGAAGAAGAMRAMPAPGMGIGGMPIPGMAMGAMAMGGMPMPGMPMPGMPGTGGGGGVSPQMLEMGRQLMAQGMSAGQIAQMAQQQGMNLSAEQVQQALGGGGAAGAAGAMAGMAAPWAAVGAAAAPAAAEAVWLYRKGGVRLVLTIDEQGRVTNIVLQGRGPYRAGRTSYNIGLGATPGMIFSTYGFPDRTVSEVNGLEYTYLDHGVRFSLEDFSVTEIMIGEKVSEVATALVQGEEKEEPKPTAPAGPGLSLETLKGYM